MRNRIFALVAVMVLATACTLVCAQDVPTTTLSPEQLERQIAAKEGRCRNLASNRDSVNAGLQR